MNNTKDKPEQQQQQCEMSTKANEAFQTSFIYYIKGNKWINDKFWFYLKIALKELDINWSNFDLMLSDLKV